MAGWSTARQASAKPPSVKAGGTTTIRYENFDGVGDVTVRVTRPDGTVDSYTGPSGSGSVEVTAPASGQYLGSVSQQAPETGHTYAATFDFVAR